jgi:hypothetical protein
MKNIQVIDSAENCSYSVYAISDEAFAMLFPTVGQNVEFIEDVVERIGESKAADIIRETWNSRIAKINIMGIHGTLFFDLHKKTQFYPRKNELD